MGFAVTAKPARLPRPAPPPLTSDDGIDTVTCRLATRAPALPLLGEQRRRAAEARIPPPPRLAGGAPIRQGGRIRARR